VIDVRRDGPDRWTAVRGAEVVGRLRALVRPDGRCHLLPRDVATDAYGPLVDEALRALGRDLYVEVDEAAADVRRVLAARGFTVHRREHRYQVPTDLSRVGLAQRSVPDGFGVVSAAGADVDRLRALDDALRQDVPGAAGWRNDPREFGRQTFGDPEFDPATYVLAVEEGTGDYVGLVRVWNRPGGPRLGLIGTLRPYRRRGLAMALIARAFGVLHRRGQPEASCEVDRTNTASNALVAGLNARRVGGNIELARRLDAVKGQPPYRA
jgi:hypothetical protein